MGETAVRILVVDNELPIRRFLRASLGSYYQLLEAESGDQALQAVVRDRPDLVILDLGLPDMDGTELTRRLREWSTVPVIAISVRDREEDKITALDAGADDYLTKPFTAGELMARIRAAMRRAGPAENEAVYRSGALLVDLLKREVRMNGQPIPLTPTEYGLLRALVTHAGQVLTQQHLIREVWAGNEPADAHLLRVNISNLRKKIEPNPLQARYIVTEPGVGYRLVLLETEKDPG
jgi:two-component system, OmpR family, KDP operon response regulator KdpE